MSDTFISEHNIPLINCHSVLTVEALDGKPIGRGKVAHITSELQLQVGILHQEQISFYVIHSPHNPIILGLPWLRSHNPHVSWREGEILQWDSRCLNHCLQPVKPLPLRSIKLQAETPEKMNIPTEYADLAVAFSKQKATLQLNYYPEQPLPRVESSLSLNPKLWP